MSSGSTAFPAGLDSNAVVDNTTEITSTIVNNLAVQIEALQAKVGIDSSTDEDSLDYKVSRLWPVGSIYINATDDTNPATLLGFGTWTAFGVGKVMVGLDGEDADFDTAEETGGAKTMAHTHTTPDHTHTTADHTHTINHQHPVISGDGIQPGSGTVRSYDYSGSSGGASTGNTTSGASTGNTTSAASNTNNLQPYVVVYMWKRTE